MAKGSAVGQPPVRIAVVNPNSSKEMTHGLEQAIASLHLSDDIEIRTYTAPENSPASINDDEGLAASTAVVLADADGLEPLRDYDAILVACYSVHPLVMKLRDMFERPAVLGIFESSILTSLALLPAYAVPGTSSLQTWGIVTTGTFWEENLSEGVCAFLAQTSDAKKSAKFAGVFSTGLVAADFHGGVSQDEIREKLKDATRRLLTSSRVGCVVMGCAGMAGLEEIIRETATETYGSEAGKKLYIIDGVKAGVHMLVHTVLSKRLFQGGQSS